MNAEEIYSRIQRARDRAGRKDRIYFVAVSKTRTTDEMKQAWKFTCIDFFGENRMPRTGRLQYITTRRAG